MSPDSASPISAIQSISDADCRLMVDAVGDYAIFMLDPQGRVCSWNSGAQRLQGYSQEEVLGRSFEIFYPQDVIDSGRPQQELDAALRTGRVEDEGWRLRKDGSRFWANVIVYPLLDADGSHRGFVKVTRDRTSHREQEELLRQSEEKFRLLVEGVRDYAIFMLDPTGHVVSWNLGAQINKGYIAEEILGEHFSVFYPKDKIEQQWPQKELKFALRDGRFEDEGWRLRKDGTRFWANVVITALYDEHGRHRGFAKVTRDLTERRRVDVLEDEGRQLTQFLAILGHELRNPLAPISNAVSILSMEELSPRLQLVRDVLTRQVDHLSHLIDDLLDVGRIVSGKMHLERVPALLQDVVDEALEAIAPTVQKHGHRLDTRIDESPLWVSGDKVRLVQVLTNLLNNACKFTPDGGRVLVDLKRRGDHAELSVNDTGCGIQPNELQYVFKLFAQGHDVATTGHGSGLGVGLNLVHQMVARHGGEVSVFSTGEPGQGAEFVVRLPLIEAPHEEVSAAPEPNAVAVKATPA
jgi:PAS domain S-box-containing protein